LSVITLPKSLKAVMPQSGQFTTKTTETRIHTSLYRREKS